MSPSSQEPQLTVWTSCPGCGCEYDVTNLPDASCPLCGDSCGDHDDQEWYAWGAVCAVCEHEWVHVFADDCAEVHCPSCNSEVTPLWLETEIVEE